MKKVISLLMTVMMLFSISIVCTSAYTLPEGFAVSSDEGTAFDAVDGTAIGYMGDADNSSDVSIKDATAIQKHIAKLEILGGDAVLLADVDFSNDITIKDATAIQKWLAKLEIDEPVYHLVYIENTNNLEPPHNHIFNDATCTTPKTCDICGATSGFANGHSFANGYCPICGEYDPEYNEGSMVWIPTNGGTKYHAYSSCSNMLDPMFVSKPYAEYLGFTPCKRCH